MVVFPYSTEVSAVEGPPQGQWTYADWEKILDDEHIYEVIDGVLYVSKSPSTTHQTVLANLYDLAGYPARQQKLARVFFAPVGVVMPGLRSCTARPCGGTRGARIYCRGARYFWRA
jgi:Uma2 family endonuclease